MIPKTKKEHAIKLREKEFSLLLKIFREQPWLGAREEAMFELLKCCRNSGEHSLIGDLFLRFHYLTSSKCSEYLEIIVNKIIREWRLGEEQTQIVATTYDEDADSAQLILWMLKPEFVKKGWDSVKLINRVGKSVKHFLECPNVVLVDEFAGTGATLVNRIRHLKKAYEQVLEDRKIQRNYTIKVCVLGSMEDAKNVVEQEGVEMFATLWMKKAISGYYNGGDLESAVRGMLRLESELKDNINGIPLPSFGDGGAEALYSLENGNTPNSVFPIFWWPYSSNGKRRKTVLHRMDRNLA